MRIGEIEEILSGRGFKMERKKSAHARANKKLIFYCAFMAYPVLQFAIFYLFVNFNSVLLAFKNIDVYNYNKFTWTFENFTRWFKDPTMFDQMIHAAGISLKVYLITLIVGVPLGLFFSYYIFKKLPAAVFFRVMLFMPSILSSVVLVGIYMSFMDTVAVDLLKKWFGVSGKIDFFGADKRFGTVMFYNIFIGFATSVLMYANKMSSISSEVIESAHLDGASGIKEFWYIVLPMSFSTVSVFLVTGVAGIFTNQFNGFLFFNVTPNEETMTLGYLLYLKTYSAKQNIAEYPVLSSLGLMITAIAVPLTFAVKRLLDKYGPRED